tara:strand:- start:99 stop:272 length:174 start_codon:yes stop_codon:yes gene_type:complete
LVGYCIFALDLHSILSDVIVVTKTIFVKKRLDIFSRNLFLLFGELLTNFKFLLGAEK